MPRKRPTHFYAYRIDHVETGRYYVGVRSSSEIPENDGYLGSGRLIRCMVAKHGRSGFVKRVLETFDSMEKAYEYESKTVTPEVLSDPLCLNLTTGGPLGRGLPSAETRALQSCQRKGRKASAETRAKMSASARSLTGDKRVRRDRGLAIGRQLRRDYGWVPPRSGIEKMAASLRGRRHSEEHRAKVSAALRARDPSSAETRAKISRSLSGRSRPIEVVEKMRASAIARRDEISAQMRAVWAARKAAAMAAK